MDFAHTEYLDRNEKNERLSPELTCEEIKSKLKTLGIVTRVRKREKLLELLHMHNA